MTFFTLALLKFPAATTAVSGCWVGCRHSTSCRSDNATSVSTCPLEIVRCSMLGEQERGRVLTSFGLHHLLFHHLAVVELVGGPGTATLHQATWLHPPSLSRSVGLRLLSFLAEAWLGLGLLQAGCQQQVVAHVGLLRLCSRRAPHWPPV